LERLSPERRARSSIAHGRSAAGSKPPTPWARGARLGNERAARFYRAYGFRETERFGVLAEGILFGMALPG
jgi:hypothetical protein